MREFRYIENENTHYMYGRANAGVKNGRSLQGKLTDGTVVEIEAGASFYTDPSSDGERRASPNKGDNLKNLVHVTPLGSDEDVVARISEAAARVRLLTRTPIAPPTLSSKYRYWWTQF
ncbi:hypothetical protein TNCV_3192251 [Trichonephila clavipes]|nr:hypothetical protein TNCV_3192251 [Trichonephila clavipes]